MITKHFLIEHDRHRKVPTKITEYDDDPQAQQRLYELDLEQLDELNACLKAGKPVRMEYVVISAKSLETVMQTHSRYFIGDFQVFRPDSPLATPEVKAETEAVATAAAANPA